MAVGYLQQKGKDEEERAESQGTGNDREGARPGLVCKKPFSGGHCGFLPRKVEVKEEKEKEPPGKCA